MRDTDDLGFAERRSCERYDTGTEQVTLVQSEQRLEAFICNVSIGGVGLETRSVERLAYGQEVQVLFADGESHKGYVRSIARRNNDSYRINISWNGLVQRNDDGTKAVAHYFLFEDSLFVCQLLYNEPGPLKTVRLWDGAVFRVPSDQLCSRTLETRRAELYDQDLDTFGTLYNLALGSSDDPVQSILDFEFSRRDDG